MYNYYSAVKIWTFLWFQDSTAQPEESENSDLESGSELGNQDCSMSESENGSLPSSPSLSPHPRELQTHQDSIRHQRVPTSAVVELENETPDGLASSKLDNIRVESQWHKFAEKSNLSNPLNPPLCDKEKTDDLETCDIFSHCDGVNELLDEEFVQKHAPHNLSFDMSWLTSPGPIMQENPGGTPSTSADVPRPLVVEKSKHVFGSASVFGMNASADVPKPPPDHHQAVELALNGGGSNAEQTPSNDLDLVSELLNLPGDPLSVETEANASIVPEFGQDPGTVDKHSLDRPSHVTAVGSNSHEQTAALPAKKTGCFSLNQGKEVSPTQPFNSGQSGLKMPVMVENHCGNTAHDLEATTDGNTAHDMDARTDGVLLLSSGDSSPWKPSAAGVSDQDDSGISEDSQANVRTCENSQRNIGNIRISEVVIQRGVETNGEVGICNSDFGHGEQNTDSSGKAVGICGVDQHYLETPNNEVVENTTGLQHTRASGSKICNTERAQECLGEVTTESNLIPEQDAVTEFDDSICYVANDHATRRDQMESNNMALEPGKPESAKDDLDTDASNNNEEKEVSCLCPVH